MIHRPRIGGTIVAVNGHRQDKEAANTRENEAGAMRAEWPLQGRGESGHHGIVYGCREYAW